MKQPEQVAIGGNSAWVLLLAGWLFASSVVHELQRTGASPEQPGSDHLHLESACPRDLRRLPGIGPARAAAIAETRWELGGEPFPLPLVSGIGEKTAERVQLWLDQQ